MIETDCLQVVQLWNKLEFQPSITDPILRENNYFRFAFQVFPLSSVSRNCNKVAHILAKQVSASQASETRRVTPTCVYDLIMLEASAS